MKWSVVQWCSRSAVSPWGARTTIRSACSTVADELVAPFSVLGATDCCQLSQDVVDLGASHMVIDDDLQARMLMRYHAVSRAR